MKKQALFVVLEMRVAWLLVVAIMKNFIIINFSLALFFLIW